MNQLFKYLLKIDQYLYLQFAEVREWIDTIRENTLNMRNSISSSAFHYNDKEIREKVESKIDESLVLCKQVWNRI